MYNTYSEGPLSKKFICNYCGKAFRTRQGLSGHIQWKHGAKQKPQEIDTDLLLSKAAELKMWKEAFGLSQSAFQAMLNILVSWHTVQSFCGIFGIELNAQDFKNYLIASFTQLFYVSSQSEPRA